MRLDHTGTNAKRGIGTHIRSRTGRNSAVLTGMLSITAILFSTLPIYCVVGRFPLYDYVLLFGLISAWFFRDRFHKNSPAVRCMILIFAVLMLICQLSHRERIDYLRNMLEYIGPFILLGCFIESRKQINTVVDLILVFTAFICVMGILEHVTRFNVWSILENEVLDNEMGSISQVRYGMYKIEQSFGQCLSYSSYLLAISVLAYYRFFSVLSKKSRVLLLGFLLLVGLNVFWTDSHLAFIIFLLLGIGVVFVRFPRKKRMIMVTAVTGLFFAFFILYFTGLLDQNTYVLSLVKMFDPTDTVYGTSMSYRMGLLTAFPSIIKGNYALGCGTVALQEPFFIRTVACPTGFPTVSIDNNYLFRTAQYGLVGLSAFLLYYLGTVILVTVGAVSTGKKKMKLLFHEHPFLIVVPVIVVMYLFIWISVAQINEFRVFNVILGLYAAYFRVFTEEARAHGLGKYSAKRVDFMKITIDNLSMEETVDQIDRTIQNRGNAYVVTPNVDHLVIMEENEEFCEAYRNADLVLTDGMPILWISHLYRKPIREKVSGSDLFLKICNLASQNGYRVYFLGAAEGVADKAAARLQNRFPGLSVVGTYAPPLGFEENPAEVEKTISKVKKAAPDILVVCLGAPKQEIFLYCHREEIGVPVSLGLGASLDFEAGTEKRAPKWMSENGLEWFHRMMQEPGRLCARYKKDAVKILPIIWKYRPGRCKRSEIKH